MSITWETASALMDGMCFALCQTLKGPVDVEGIQEMTRELFRKYCEIEGITGVEVIEEGE